jgi:hypothetical protein
MIKLDPPTTEQTEAMCEKFREQLKPWPANYPETTADRARMQAYLSHSAVLLAKEADRLGFVLSITQHPAGPTPRMGHHNTGISVTPKRIPS